MLNNASRHGRTDIIRAARDPVQVPTEPDIVRIIENSLCVCTLGHNCYVLTNVYGVELTVPYGASLIQWQNAANQLLEQAMNATP
jgi:hypothetical protein